MRVVTMRRGKSKNDEIKVDQSPGIESKLLSMNKSKRF